MTGLYKRANEPRARAKPTNQPQEARQKKNEKVVLYDIIFATDELNMISTTVVVWVFDGRKLTVMGWMLIQRRGGTTKKPTRITVPPASN